ncbi:MAG: hypothetical protein ACR2HG_10195 [Pyrinomonadaceae bacterium]
MDEAEFQAKVLIPLFRAMKFRDVTAFGGGNLERGKDIVMWKESDLGQRLNYGVVVKAKKITGNAETNSGAMNILTQVRQMLKTSFLNPVSGEKERIQRCFVACSKEITKEAMNSIEGELDNQLDKLVEWLHPGTNLYDKIEEYLPEQGIFEKLSSVQEELDKATKDTPYKLVADSDKKISILGKHEKAHEEMPFEIKIGFKFDKKTKEGRKALDEFKEHFDKGSPVEIDGKHIESFELPNFLPEWMKPQTTENAKLILQPNRSDFIIPLKIERKLSSGNIVSLDRIDLERVKPGTEEFTLKNDRQNVTWQFTFVFNRKENSFKFEFTNKFYGFNVAQHLQSLKFFDSMSKDGETTIYHADTGLKILNADKTKVVTKENFDGWIELLEALVFTQEKIPVLLMLSTEKLSDEEISHIFEVANVIKKGKVETSVSITKTTTTLEKAVETAEQFANEKVNPILISYKDGWKTKVLENEIDLGVAVVSFDVYIAEKDFIELEKAIEAKEKEIEITFSPKSESATIDFLRWDCEDRHNRLQITDSKN